MDGSGLMSKPIKVGDVIPYAVDERYGFLWLRKRVVFKQLSLTRVDAFSNYFYYEGSFVKDTK